MMMTHEGAAVACNVTRDALNILFDCKGGIAAVGNWRCSINAVTRSKPSPAKNGTAANRKSAEVVVKPEDLLKAGLA
jgi:hypothetical protein